MAYAAGYVNKSTEPDGTLSYLRPWDTQEKAIKGGAKFIAEAYTNKGQNTNYFEKFNVSTYSAYTKYTHQYMTNAYAPAGEAIKLYNAYNAGNLLNSSFNFIIPVYENMGSDAFQAINRSNDAKLSNITVDGKTITGFQKDVVDILAKKTMRALKEYNVNNLIICGGVAANRGIRDKFMIICKENNIDLTVPSIKYCTDNAAMIAASGYYAYINNIVSDLSLDAVATESIDRYLEKYKK